METKTESSLASIEAATIGTEAGVGELARVLKAILREMQAQTQELRKIAGRLP